MFEFWFHGVRDPQDPESSEPFNHNGTTHDFLEVCSQIAQFFNHEVAGSFVQELLAQQVKELAFLRVVDWKVEFNFIYPTDAGTQSKIVLHKVR